MTDDNKEDDVWKSLYISAIHIVFFDFLLLPSRIKSQGTCLLAYCALPSRSAEWPKGFGKFMASWLIAGGCMYQVTIFRLGSGHWLVWVLNKWSCPWSLVKVRFAMMFLVGIVSCKTCTRKWRDRLVIQEYQLFSFLEWSFFFWCVDCLGDALLRTNVFFLVPMNCGLFWESWGWWSLSGIFGWPHLKP